MRRFEDIKDILLDSKKNKDVSSIEIGEETLFMEYRGYGYSCNLSPENIDDLVRIYDKTNLDILRECIINTLTKYIFS